MTCGEAGHDDVSPEEWTGSRRPDNGYAITNPGQRAGNVIAVPSNSRYFISAILKKIWFPIVLNNSC